MNPSLTHSNYSLLINRLEKETTDALIQEKQTRKMAGILEGLLIGIGGGQLGYFTIR
ncbi:hypothetical protein [Neobacillus jeddahensis]|uniref:hypothetical protein n=1 Tax=Neobacillus jeddahensis TaxID=1461580 RepID=UPI000A6F07AF|nr:hypothetical protein [Neobacillus jeddahensis]